MYKKTSISKNHTYLIVAGAVLVIIAIVLVSMKVTDRGLFSKASQNTAPASPDNINFNPPTPEERQDADDKKGDIVTESPIPAPPTPPIAPGSPPSQPARRPVKPIVVSAANGEVRSSIPGVIENGGTCIARFTSGTQSVTKTSPPTAFADAQQTICPPISYSGSEVSHGWSVTVTYQSAASEGASDASAVQ